MARAVVVGGGGGTDLAREVALGFARAGDWVLLLGSGGVAGLADDLTARLPTGAGRVDWYEVDLAEPAEVARLVADRFGEGQRLDVLVATPDPGSEAAPGPAADPLARTADRWHAALRTSVLPAVLLTEALAFAFRPGGRVVLVSPVGPDAGNGDGDAACAATTAALHGWAERQARPLGAAGVTVNVVAVGRGEADVVAAIGYLTSAAAGATTGQLLRVG